MAFNLHGKQKGGCQVEGCKGKLCLGLSDTFNDDDWVEYDPAIIKANSQQIAERERTAQIRAMINSMDDNRLKKASKIKKNRKMTRREMAFRLREKQKGGKFFQLINAVGISGAIISVLFPPALPAFFPAALLLIFNNRRRNPNKYFDKR